MYKRQGCHVQGFLKQAMMYYLSLLGWNDGSEQEIYSVEELQQAFEIERITKSPAVFDKVKLAWMNGQHLRALPTEEVCLFEFAVGTWHAPMVSFLAVYTWHTPAVSIGVWLQVEELVGAHLVAAGDVKSADSPFTKAAVALMQQSLELVQDSSREIKRMAVYPLQESLASGALDQYKEDGLKEVCESVLSAYESGALPEVCARLCFLPLSLCLSLSLSLGCRLLRCRLHRRVLAGPGCRRLPRLVQT